MELISYAMDFASFLIQNLKEKEKIKSIILFGSVARDKADKGSDIDLFIDITEEDKKLKEQISKINNKFFDSVKFKNYWKHFDIKNSINIILGKLEKWKLRDAMLGNAIVLYQKYTPKLDKGKNQIILNWGTINNNSKRVMLNKKLFGYNYYNKNYKGVLEIYEGKKLGTNVIIIPAEHLNLFIKIFHKFKIPVKIKRIFEYKE